MQRWGAVAVDLDGTLIIGTARRHLAGWLGHSDEVAELERRRSVGELDSCGIAAAEASHYAGRTLGEVRERLSSLPCVGDVSEGVTALRALGVSTVVTSVTWSFAADSVADRFGFDASLGAEMGVDPGTGTLDGTLVRCVDPAQKVEYMRRFAERRGFGLDRVVAIGDGSADVPLFEAVGYAVAFNASDDARDAARVTVDSISFLDALMVVPDLFS